MEEVGTWKWENREEVNWAYLENLPHTNTELAVIGSQEVLRQNWIK